MNGSTAPSSAANSSAESIRSRKLRAGCDTRRGGAQSSPSWASIAARLLPDGTCRQLIASTRATRTGSVRMRQRCPGRRYSSARASGAGTTSSARRAWTAAALGAGAAHGRA